jgi:hypothetical protein
MNLSASSLVIHCYNTSSFTVQYANAVRRLCQPLYSATHVPPDHAPETMLALWEGQQMNCNALRTIQSWHLLKDVLFWGRGSSLAPSGPLHSVTAQELRALEGMHACGDCRTAEQLQECLTKNKATRYSNQ